MRKTLGQNHPEEAQHSPGDLLPNRPQQITDQHLIGGESTVPSLAALLEKQAAAQLDERCWGAYVRQIGTSFDSAPLSGVTQAVL